MVSRSVFTCALLSTAWNLPQFAKAQSRGATSMNPDISLSLLVGYKNAKRVGATKTEPGGGFSLDEAELQFQADVDPYFRAVATFSVHPEEEEGSENEGEGTAATEDPAAGTAAAEEKHFAIEAEEAYLETLSLPNLTLKAGRFHTAMGRHNSLHRHAYPFIDAPLINQRLLGEEGLTETGVSAAALAPLPWYMEATLQAVQGDSPTLFASESSTDTAMVYQLRNLWDLSDATTLDFNLSGTSGANQYGERSNVGAADFTVKWRPTSGGRYQALLFTAEYMAGKVEGRPVDEEQAGYAAWIQYQFAERWWAQLRTEEAKSKDEGAVAEKKISALIAFYPSEFSGLRMQIDQLSDADRDHPLRTFLLQGNIVIGAHPAHAY